ncbi:hypothetical protein B0H11DRAFT_2076137, partial [Mycena galericulata]
LPPIPAPGRKVSIREGERGRRREEGDRKKNEKKRERRSVRLRRKTGGDGVTLGWSLRLRGLRRTLHAGAPTTQSLCPASTPAATAVHPIPSILRALPAYSAPMPTLSRPRAHRHSLSAGASPESAALARAASTTSVRPAVAPTTSSLHKGPARRCRPCCCTPEREGRIACKGRRQEKRGK